MKHSKTYKIKHPKGQKLFIASCDGGGTKGYFSVRIWAEIERRLGRPVNSWADAYAGTSIGGIIAAALALGIAIGKMLGFFLEKAGIAFEKKGWLRTIWQRIKNLPRDGFSQPLYEEDGLVDSLHEFFGERIIGDLQDSPLLLVTADATAQKMAYINTALPPRPWPSDRAFSNCMEGIETMSLVDALRATSAAPGYFRPLIHLIAGKLIALIDGGVGANNPAALAIAQFRHIFRTKANRPIPLSQIVVVSVGTGKSFVPIPANEVRGSGFIEWIRRKLVSWLIGFPAEATRDVAEGILESGNHIRFNLDIPEELDDMDESDPEFFAKCDPVLDRWFEKEDFEEKIRRLRRSISENEKAAA